MAQKIPPPPPIASGDVASFIQSLPAFNRWLLELTGILAASGGIDPNTIDGFAELQNQVEQNTADIVTLQGEVGTLNGLVGTLQAQVSDLLTRMAAAESAITSLQARAQPLNGVGAPAAGLGNVGDWYANVGGAAGARIYIKTAVATWTPFPF